MPRLTTLTRRALPGGLAALLALAGCASRRPAPPTLRRAQPLVAPTAEPATGQAPAPDSLPAGTATTYLVVAPPGATGRRGGRALLRKCRGCTIVVGTGNQVTTATVGKVRAPLAVGPAASVASATAGSSAAALRGQGNSATTTATTTGPARGTRLAELLLGPLGKALGVVAAAGGAWLLLGAWRRGRQA